MNSRVFLFLIIPLLGLAVLTSPAILDSLLPPEATATAVSVEPTATVSPTRDPFADLPLATPWGREAGVVYSPPTAAATPTPVGSLPASRSTPNFTIDIEARELGESDIPPAPTPGGAAPERLAIPRLGLEAPVEPVGMVSSPVAPGVVEWGVPDHRAAGWLNTSAPFGQAGNTVLAGHHNIKGEVFRNLWTLQAGDEIRLYSNGQTRPYRVEEVLILPEKEEPLEVRLANARYIQPTQDERLTLITCWPYENNTHRTVVVALPTEHSP